MDFTTYHRLQGASDRARTFTYPTLFTASGHPDLSKICNGQYTISPEDYVELRHGPRRESRMIPISRQPKLELSHQDFFIRTSRLLRVLPSIDVTKPIGWKPKFLCLFWNHFDTNYTENNLCSWRIGCRCSGCITRYVYSGHVPLNL